MASRTVTVGSTVGLHARPAAVIAEAADNYEEEVVVRLADGEGEADATSALEIMALGAEQGDTVTVVSDNAEAVEKIASLIAQNLD